MADLRRCSLFLYAQKLYSNNSVSFGFPVWIYVEGILANSFRNTSIGSGTENHDILNSSFYNNIDRMSTTKNNEIRQRMKNWLCM